MCPVGMYFLKKEMFYLFWDLRNLSNNQYDEVANRNS